MNIINTKKELRSIKDSLANELTAHNNGVRVFFDYKTGWQIRPVNAALGKELGVEWLK